MEFGSPSPQRQAGEYQVNNCSIAYSSWRQTVIPAIRGQLEAGEPAAFDDLYEYDDIRIMDKEDLDIERIHFYIENIEKLSEK